MRVNLLLRKRLNGILLTAVPFKVQNWSHCPTMQPTSEFGKIPCLDISRVDYLTSWIAVAFKVDSAQECSGSSGLVPRLGRWLASELIKGLKAILELQFKVQGYIESCARQSLAPRGRAVIQMISRHFDLDRR